MFRTARRFASTEAKLTVNFVVPHQPLLTKQVVKQVNLSSTAGDLGILANHVPTVLQLRPGVISFIGDKTQSWFVSGGFAVVNPDSSLNVNAVEAFDLQDVDFEQVRSQHAEATKRAQSANKEEQVEAKIQLEVLDALLKSK
ncbi:F1 complex, delta/epsilon subunit of ATPase [Gorgonomyces haynaldii]|nr:F1 complex, delta/epsilon subunit of ATPase [Gorgonomyces haynaldii]